VQKPHNPRLKTDAEAARQMARVLGTGLAALRYKDRIRET
jgi:hypothetical protein